MWFVVEKAYFFKRWHVYSIGPGSRMTWLATFAKEADANAWIGTLV